MAMPRALRRPGWAAAVGPGASWHTLGALLAARYPRAGPRAGSWGCPWGAPHRSPQAARATAGLSIMVQGWVLWEQVPFPERDRRDLFTQEGARRCEKGHTCPSGCYLSPGCAKGLHRASPEPLSAPNFYLPKGLLPAFWGAAASTGPRCHPLHGPAAQVNPSLLLLACAVGRSRRRGGHAGSPRAALSQHGNNSGTWSCVCSAPTAGHRVQARGGEAR